MGGVAEELDNLTEAGLIEGSAGRISHLMKRANGDAVSLAREAIAALGHVAQLVKATKDIADAGVAIREEVKALKAAVSDVRQDMKDIRGGVDESIEGWGRKIEAIDDKLQRLGLKAESATSAMTDIGAAHGLARETAQYASATSEDLQRAYPLAQRLLAYLDAMFPQGLPPDPTAAQRPQAAPGATAPQTPASGPGARFRARARAQEPEPEPQEGAT